MKSCIGRGTIEIMNLLAEMSVCGLPFLFDECSQDLTTSWRSWLASGGHNRGTFISGGQMRPAFTSYTLLNLHPLRGSRDLATVFHATVTFIYSAWGCLWKVFGNTLQLWDSWWGRGKVIRLACSNPCWEPICGTMTCDYDFSTLRTSGPSHII